MPKVTIGLPVFNGEKYLAQAVDSILAQTFEDFELLISDNASTDGTPEICEHYVKADKRVQYFRNKVNLGAAPNFNGLVPKARGMYFKWAACDDLLEPDFLRACIEALDTSPDAVLSFSDVVVIDAEGEQIKLDHGWKEVKSPNPRVRFRRLVRPHGCREIFGVIRLNDLRRTRLILGAFHGDGVLLAQLGLLGSFVRVPELLFRSRSHSEQSASLLKDKVAYADWFDARNNGSHRLPNWRLFREFHSIVKSTVRLNARLPYYYILAKEAYLRRSELKQELLGESQRRRAASRSRRTASSPN